MPPLLPPAPQTISPAPDYAGNLFFASPDEASALTFQFRDITVSEFGLDQSLAAFVPYPPGYGMASAFDVVEPSGTFIQSWMGYILTMQMATSPNASYTARIRSHTSALGQRFRVAGFPFDASNADDAGFDFVGVYAPQDCNVTASAPPQAYARLQAMSPGASFWNRNPGPSTSIFVPAGHSVLLRTKGADAIVGARGFPIDGSLVTADRPISVSVGGRGWLFDDQNNVLGADNGFDGLVPTAYLGQKYVVSGSSAVSGQQVRITTDLNDVRLSINGNYVQTLEAGDTYRFDTPEGLTVIESSDIVAVYQSQGYYSANGDLALVQPVEFASLQNIGIAFDVLTATLGTVFVVMPTEAASSLTLNGNPASTWDDSLSMTVPGHPEWTAVWIPDIAAGGYVLHAEADMVASLLTGSLHGGAFSYISRVRRPGCGDGIINGTEECDDGNIASFDGCSSMCNLEPNFVCTGQPSMCTMRRAQSGDGSGGTISIPQAACATAGCPEGQWCTASGCVAKLNAAAPCASDDQCVAGLCADDQLCAQRLGLLCASDATCRSHACVQGICVDAGAHVRGGGLMSCARSGQTGRASFAELWNEAVVGCGLWATSPGARRRRRLRRSADGEKSAGNKGRRGSDLRLWMGLVAGLLWLGASQPARAEGGFSLSPLPMQQMGTPWLLLDGLAPLGAIDGNQSPHSLGVRIGGRFDAMPLWVQNGQNTGSLGTVVSDQATLSATVAYWWRQAGRLSLSVPWQVHAAGQQALAAPMAAASPRRGAALGDVRASGTWIFWRSRQGTWRSGVDAQLLVPTGSQASYLSNKAAAGTLTLSMAGRRGRFDATVALAAWAGGGPRGTSASKATVGLAPRAGAGVYWAHDAWHAGLEVPVQVALGHVLPGCATGTTWADPLVSLRYQWSPRWAALLGAGTSITSAPGEARYRILAAIDAVPWRSREATHAVVSPAAPETPPASAAAQVPPEVVVPPVLVPVPEPLPTEAPTPPELPVRPAPVVLPYRVQFALESPHYGPESRQVLREVAAYLQEHPGIVLLKVLGYTDITGTTPYNQQLSERRAQNVKRALQRLGVPEERLRAQGHGAQEFSHDNTTRLGRQANRRVIFVGFEVLPEDL